MRPISTPKATAVTLLWTVAVALVGTSRVLGEADEVRVFAVELDGKPAGQYRMTIRGRANHQTTMQAEMEIRVPHLLRTTRHSFNTLEIWRGGTLRSLEAASGDGRKIVAVVGKREGDVLRVVADGVRKGIGGVVWPTTYWRLPNADQRTEVFVLDAETGETTRSALHRVGSLHLAAAGRNRACTHWTLVGGPNVDLYFDDSDRLIREELQKDGRRMVLRLTGLEAAPKE